MHTGEIVKFCYTDLNSNASMMELGYLPGSKVPG